jgi:hypothetical protein
MNFTHSNLYKNLTVGSHDTMYCAMTYITRCGGPSIVGHPDDLANLLASRKLMIEWLIGRQDKDKIIEEYTRFQKRWSPVFDD